MKIHQHQMVVRRAIAAGIISLVALPSVGNGMVPPAVETRVIAAQLSSVAFNPPPPPPDRDAPGNRGGGAGRGCGTGSQPAIALVPEYQQVLAQGGTITKVWGTTLAERPTFWFDVPYGRDAIDAVEFVLQDNSNPAKDVYRSAIAPPDVPGIVSIQLPATVPPLETGPLYQWFFKVRLQCGSKETLYGWVQRTSPDAALTSQLKQATQQQQADLYAQNGIWFDALTTLGNLRLTKLQDPRLTASWNSLLQSVGLEKLTTKPLLPCCKPSSAGFTPPPDRAVPGRRQGSPGR